MDDIGHDRDDDHLYPIETLRRVTHDFSEENILRQGGFGSFTIEYNVMAPPSLLRGWTLELLMKGY